MREREWVSIRVGALDSATLRHLTRSWDEAEVARLLERLEQSRRRAAPRRWPQGWKTQWRPQKHARRPAPPALTREASASTARPAPSRKPMRKGEWPARSGERNRR
jgi:hypothetical protein